MNVSDDRRPGQDRPIARREPATLLVLSLFFVSGMSGLVYEVAWTRMFGVVFGNTTHAVSTVLAAYMGGLALGSLLLGRWGDRLRRPVLAYGILEISIGVYALLVPLMIRHLTGFYSVVFAAFGQEPLPVAAVRFLLSFGLLLVPTTLMGGTLPILSGLVGRDMSRLGRNVGTLYAFNTLGAVVGSFITGFVLLEAMGVASSVLAAALASIAVGAVASVSGRRWRAAVPQEVREVPGEEEREEHVLERVLPRYSTAVALVAFAVSGCAALGYEVLYTKVLVFSLGSSAHAFSLMLTTFLVGLAVGSFVASRLVDRWTHPIEAFGLVELAIGASVLASIYALSRLDLAHHYLAIKDAGGGLVRLRLAGFLEASLVMLAPTLLMGATFPLVARICARRGRVSSSVGRLYFFNTVGAVAGSLAAGFVLVPLLGTARSITLLVALNVAAGLLLFSCTRRRRAFQAAALLGLAAMAVAASLVRPSAFARAFNIKQPGSDLVYFKEGASGTVTVHRFPDYDLLAIDGVDVAGSSLMLRVTQKLQAHLPVLLADRADRVAHIGFGSGETMHVLTLHGVPAIDGIEICRDVITAAKRFFSALNLGVFDLPHINIIIMDGKNYILLTRQQYDVIMTDSIYPGSGGASALYTRDHFAEVRKHLRPGGIASCWLPLDISKRDLATALAAFNEAFPDMTVWYFYMSFSQHALLVGKKDAPVAVDWAELARAFEDPALREDLASILIDDPAALISCLIADGRSVRQFCGDAPANSDDHPVLEFGIARRGSAMPYLAANLEEMLVLRPDQSTVVVKTATAGPEPVETAGKIEAKVEVSRHITAGHIASARGETGLARASYQKALAADPGNRPALACLSALEASLGALVAATRAGLDDYETNYGLGARYLAEGQFGEAEVYLKKAQDMRPASPDPYVSLGECYLRSGRFSEALENMTRAADLLPQDDGVQVRLGMSYEALGRRQEAMFAYEKAVRLNPENYEARNNLGSILLAQGDIARARGELTEAVRIAPARPHAIANLGLTYARERNWPAAIGQFRRAAEVDPTFYTAYFHLGNALYETGDRQGASAAWKRTLELKPDHQGALRNLQALGRL